MNFKNKINILITLIILLNISKFQFLFQFISKSNLFKDSKLTLINENFATLSKKIVHFNNSICKYIKLKLKNRIHPLDFENELLFFASLISCKIPFSFIRFGDGENSIMKGDMLNVKTDKWYWRPSNKEFKDSLIESASVCTKPNNFIGIPCKNWIEISRSILSFSKCSSAKYMSFATLFINKNYQLFKEWIIHFINIPNRWKIILVCNSIINKNISWAFKFFPVPDHLIENWDEYGISLLDKLSQQAKKNNLIFFISAGPAANIIISNLIRINKYNIYIDFGSSIEFLTKGYTTRPYAENTKYSYQSCEAFYLQNKTLFYY